MENQSVIQACIDFLVSVGRYSVCACVLVCVCVCVCYVGDFTCVFCVMRRRVRT